MSDSGFRPVDPAALGITSHHAEIDTSIAHPARIYDYALGGKDNYPADREVAEKAFEALPSARNEVVANREFLHRSVAYAARHGIGQFLDIGTGIPTVGPTHETANAVRPGSRVVYIDNDPIVLVHARALLADDDRTTVHQADLRDPATVLAHARSRLDFGEPIALMFVGLLYFLTDADLEGVLEPYRDAMPAGSHLLLSHVLDTPKTREIQKIYKANAPFVPRTRAEIWDLFGGWELVEPGLTPLHEWRPDGGECPAGHMLGGVAVKPA